MLDLLRQRRVPIALITNATTRLPQDLAALDLDGGFDHVINSSVVGVAKPDTGIFAAAIQALDLPADQVLLVDDDPRHVAAATKLDIRSYQFQRDIPTLKELLKETRIVR